VEKTEWKITREKVYIFRNPFSHKVSNALIKPSLEEGHGDFFEV
jgi:hypothetical protein